MSKSFRAWKIDEPPLLPVTVQEFVAADHLARLLLSMVEEELDLIEIMSCYCSEKGQPPFHPAMMTALLLYGYCGGVHSSRRIAKACVERVDFMSIVAFDPPDFRTIAEFRRRHLRALAGLFVQVLALCDKAGLTRLGHVAFDGSKVRANASKHKAMSYGRMEARAGELEAEVDQRLAAAEAADAAEDQLYGRDKRVMLEACLRHDELPAWVADKKRRAAKIRAAKAELEAEAKAAAEAKAKAAAEAEEANLAGLEERKIDAYVATGRARDAVADAAQEEAAPADAAAASERSSASTTGSRGEAIPAAQAGGRAGVRADQAGARLPPVPAAGPREGAR